ncbi:MAG: TonB-dependent receptor [Bacteroidota bacterium]
MKHLFPLLAILLFANSLLSQSVSLKGVLQNTDNESVIFANIALYNANDSSLIKVETSDEAGVFRIKDLQAGVYYLTASYVGFADIRKENIQLTADESLDLGVLTFATSAVELNEVSVTAQRAMVEIKPDRTVFNVQGTVNSVGSDAISLLRKAPSVTVDNNDNISVLGRAGVLLYVDGKRLPLTGQELSNYLQSLPAEQIDRIDIITNPGAKYEAEGNAGIIDIRLKKDENLGANGSLTATGSQGRFAKANTNVSGNYRNKRVNIFANAGVGYGKIFHNMDFQSQQNGLSLTEKVRSINTWDYGNLRLGTDFFLNKKHTLGFLVEGRLFGGNRNDFNRITLAQLDAPTSIDSILIADNNADDSRTQNTWNLNYRFDNGKGRTINIDLDYGRYKNDSDRFQPNQYFNSAETQILTEVINTFETPTNIEISTFKIDFEEKMLGGVLGIGSKLSRVVSDNTFLVFDVIDGVSDRNDRSSNLFKYEENVYAGYINFARPLAKNWNLSAGLRTEQTDVFGDLQVFLSELRQPPVDLNYLNWFPSAGLTWQVAPQHSLALNYGRRINRPDYNILNPFNDKLSEISYQKGNPFLNPEIVNNIELGYTLAYRYNLKLGYSKTLNQITRLIAPDEIDPRANFITWENLANQTTISFNISAPVQISEKWNAYFNATASHLDNQANYGEGAIVDVQVFTYMIFQQHTFNLPSKFQAEVSGYFAGPGVWGGVFEYESNWSLDVGLQRRFLKEQLNVRLSASDLFYQTGWDGISSFNGLISEGGGRWDSRRVSLSLSHNFGNQKVKSRKRKTGIEDEAGRVSSEN